MSQGDVDLLSLNNTLLNVEMLAGIKRALGIVGLTGTVNYMENNNILIEVDTPSGKKTALAVGNISGGSLTSPIYESIRIGDVPGGDYFEVEEDGTFINIGDGSVWDEISKSFIGSGLFSPAGRVDYNFIELTLDYATNARYPEEPVGIVSQLSHARRTDSDIRPHIHWMQTSSDVPNILIEYRWINNGGVPDSWTLKALTALDNKFTYDLSGNMQQITEFNLPVGHGVGKGLSATFECKIYRDSANTSTLFSGVDVYSGIWSGKYYDIHIERDMNGSHEEFVK